MVRVVINLILRTVFLDLCRRRRHSISPACVSWLLRHSISPALCFLTSTSSGSWSTSSLSHFPLLLCRVLLLFLIFDPRKANLNTAVWNHEQGDLQICFLVYVTDYFSSAGYSLYLRMNIVSIFVYLATFDSLHKLYSFKGRVVDVSLFIWRRFIICIVI
jgi:hypothetical protein